tara:strand:- start:1014 stop:1280 length:267 start_codon:yes stop_codon:yes gene_type:complete
VSPFLDGGARGFAIFATAPLGVGFTLQAAPIHLEHMERFVLNELCRDIHFGRIYGTTQALQLLLEISPIAHKRFERAIMLCFRELCHG